MRAVRTWDRRVDALEIQQIPTILKQLPGPQRLVPERANVKKMRHFNILQRISRLI
jgi:hypothetical protein